MKFKSLGSKLLVLVSALVIGSSLITSLLVTERFSNSLQEAAITQGKYLAQAVALEATNKILINDLMAFQNLLNNQLGSNPAVAYLFAAKDGQILAHTFSEGFPTGLTDANQTSYDGTGNVKRIVTDEGLHYLDIAWPIFSGKGGTLRIGLSEKPYKSEISRLWLQMALFTLVVLLLAIVASFLFIKRITRPLAALADAAEKIDEDNLTMGPDPGGDDEVARLTLSFNRMIERIKRHTTRIENNAQELSRAHRQTINAFEIIQNIWAQDNLRDASSYLISKFQEIVACKELVFIIFSNRYEILFTLSDGEIKSFKQDTYRAALATLSGIEDNTFLSKQSFPPSFAPESFEFATHIATFPVLHENQLLGALLIPCPGNCRCDTREQEVIRLIMRHSSRAIKRVLSIEEEMLNIQHRIKLTTEFCGIVGKDAKMQAIYKLIEDIAPTDTSVLIQGESGTGKELVAGALHQKSLRNANPFIVINCSAYPATLLESELFGHEKGAFTGAVRQKAGRFEQANGGTVFLDEIGEIPFSAQIKLLRVLQTQKFERVGGEKTLSVDVRIIAATNKNLLQEVKEGQFREDLFYRLNVIPIQIPPLRKRQNDIPLQARFFMRRFADEQEKDIKEFSSEALRALLNYSWPGNVRELENCIEHAVVLARGDRVEVSDLPSALQQVTTTAKVGSQGQGTIMENEAKLLKEVLQECNWNKKQAAERLGISRNTLYRKLRKYRINLPTIH